MTKTEAHAILDKIRDGMSISGATRALERTGDICRLPSQSLRAIGYEQSDYRPRQTHEQTTNVGFSWSKYLDYSKTEGITQ